MGQENIRNRVVKSRGAEVVKMQFSESDLRAAKIARLEEIKNECTRANESIVFLTEISRVIGMQTDTIKLRAQKLKIKVLRRNNPASDNKMSLCVSDDDAEQLIRDFYK